MRIASRKSVDVDRRTVLREERCLFYRGVSAADHREGLIAKSRQRAITHCAGRDAFLPELPVVGARDLHSLGGRASRDDDRVGAPLLGIGLEAEGSAGEVDFVDRLGVDRRAESLRLCAKAIGQILAHDAFGKTGEVLDVRRRGELAAGCDAARHEALEKHGAQLGTCRVNRCGMGCRSAADDQDSMAHDTPLRPGLCIPAGGGATAKRSLWTRACQSQGKP